MKYIINTSADYADEFDYPICSIMTSKEYEKLINSYDKWKFKEEEEFYFGTNEYFLFTSKELFEMIKKATPVDDETFKIIKPFLPYASLDITEKVLDLLYDAEHTNS